MTDQLAQQYGYHPLIADYAYITRKAEGDCAVCHQPLARGENICRLADGTGWAHVAGCVASVRPPRTPRNQP